MGIRIVTDSSADLPPELALQWDITVIPCNVIVDDVSYKDGIEISAEEFYHRLTTGQRLPTTAQPSVADFQTAYGRLLDQGHEVISIHLSGKLSATLNSAEQAKTSIGDQIPIEIIDSNLTSMGLGLVALSAAQAAQKSTSYGQVADQVRRDLPLTQFYSVLDTLEYLQKGGRVGKAQAYVGTLLSVKPILKLQDGEVHPVERPRNRERAIRRLVELLQELSPVRQLAVMYSTEPEQAADLRSRLSNLLPEEQMITSRFGPTLGTYIGPKALGVALTSADTADPQPLHP